MKCERCWSEGDSAEPGEVELAPPLGGDDLERVPLCRSCMASAPRNPILFRKLYLRFASRKEMLQHYGTSKVSEALAHWSKEVGITWEEVLAILSVESAEFDLLTTSDLPSQRPPGLQPPFGYLVQEGRVAPSPLEASVVRGIFSRYIKGESLNELAAWLNRKGFPTRRSGKWHRSTVRYILRNPLYAGYKRRGSVLRRSSHPPLVDAETFEKAQLTLTHRCLRPDQKAPFTSLQA